MYIVFFSFEFQYVCKFKVFKEFILDCMIYLDISLSNYFSNLGEKRPPCSPLITAIIQFKRSSLSVARAYKGNQRILQPESRQFVIYFQKYSFFFKKSTIAKVADHVKWRPRTVQISGPSNSN